MGVSLNKQFYGVAADLADPRWLAVADRDAKADGKFFYSVKTTGVYCRPSCAARLARVENVRFHATCDAAEQAGFRACKRCKPNQPTLLERHAATITAACRIIEAAQESISLNTLADRVGMSPYHFHRTFKAVTGLTPRQYGAGHRADRVRQTLSNNASVTDAIIDAGYNSNSRFYERSNEYLGMTPSNYRAGGTNVAIHFAVGECRFGSILAAMSERGVCAILLGSDPDSLVRELRDRFPNATLTGGDPVFDAQVAKIIGFIEAPALGLDLPLDIGGTVFQRRVWQALRDIPAGETVSYTEVAKRIGSPKSARAVAKACAANILAVAIPCHRVVRSDGGISGYRWGVERKQELLDMESS